MHARKTDDRPTPLVLVHGNPESAAVWGPLIAALDRDDVVCLSPPGFGVPASSDFDATVRGYRDWLEERLEAFARPVDLVGHDWGGLHVAAVAMHRPELLRSWASDCLGTFHPQYEWHALAQGWQQEGVGEASVAELFEGDLQQRLAVTESIGWSGASAERLAAGLDAGMGRAVLSLLRSAAQPTMSDAGRDLPAARARPGLALIATADEDAGTTVAMHEWAAERSGAQPAHLQGLGHWWPVQEPGPGAEALQRFWASLDA